MAVPSRKETPVSNAASDPPRYQRFGDFYPVYLSEHANRTSRRLHFAGSSLALVCGYGFAWVGHFFFEHNRPATFRQPLYSLMGDWKMYWQTLTGRIPF
jgi:hypothetical protein